MTDFWSKRRAAVEAEHHAEAVEVQVALREQSEAERAAKSDDELLAEFELPAPETLGKDDDFKPFLSDAIPARIKTRALRALWRVNPVLANLDGLLDYGEDFTDAALVVENLQTTYQVGKGMMAHVEEMARQAEAEEIEEVELAESEEPEVEAEEAETEVSLAEDDHEVVETEVADAPDEIGTVVAAPRRRMQFTFEDHQTG